MKRPSQLYLIQIAVILSRVFYLFGIGGVVLEIIIISKTN
jgi:hypothetical protein